MNTITLPLLGILALGLVVLLGVLLARRPEASADRPTVLVVTRFVAVAYAVVTVIGTAVLAITTLVADTVTATVPVASDIEPFPWIEFLDGPQATMVDGGFSHADVTLSGLGMDARLWLAASQLLQGITFTLIALVIALICHRMLQGTPFRPLIARGVMAAAVTITAGGLAWQVFDGIGGSIASHQAFFVSGWGAEFPNDEVTDFLWNLGDTAIDGTGLPDATMALSVEFWPIMIGLALAALSLVFRHGERLQRDTEGLV